MGIQVIKTKKSTYTLQETHTITLLFLKEQHYYVWGPKKQGEEEL